MGLQFDHGQGQQRPRLRLAEQSDQERQKESFLLAFLVSQKIWNYKSRVVVTEMSGRPRSMACGELELSAAACCAVDRDERGVSVRRCHGVR